MQPLGVSVSRVGYTFQGGTVALDDVALDVDPGSFTALVGPSGCGKTTLLRLVGGLLRASSGELRFRGPDGSIDGITSRDVGFCFQEPRLLPWRSVVDNVALPLELAGVATDERRGRAREWLERVALPDHGDARPDELSGGMRMRVAIARALVTRPRMLLLDEPFGALDAITRQQLDDELAAVWRTHRATVLLVTHSIPEAVYLADRVHVFGPRPGTIVGSCDVRFPERTPTLRNDPTFHADVAALHAMLERAMRSAVT